MALQERLVQLEKLLGMVAPIPDDWVAGRARVAIKGGSLEVECLPCEDWEVLVTAWRKAMRWIPGLDKALGVMLACVTSTDSVGDQLWAKIIGPPSCGKSILCEALSVAKKYVTAKSTIRGFHSGYQSDKAGSEDNSLAAALYGKTLVTKDGDTLLQAPNLGQILAEARDLYDRVSRTHYRNKMSKDYEGLSMTWLLCGTESLRSLDSSELGERLLDCVIIDQMDPELEDEIALRKAYQAERDLTMKSDGTPESRDAPEMVHAKQLTGGYVHYLRENAQALLGRLEPLDEETMRRLVSLGTFVAFMRSRPSKKQDETAQRELSFRLVSQHVRLAKCLAVVMTKPRVDAAVMERVASVALDTSRGRTREITRYLYRMGEAGATTGMVCHSTGHGEQDEAKFLKFLRAIGAVEKHQIKSEETGKVLSNGNRWRLTKRLRDVYTQVVGLEPTLGDKG